MSRLRTIQGARRHSRAGLERPDSNMRKGCAPGSGSDRGRQRLPSPRGLCDNARSFRNRLRHAPLSCPGRIPPARRRHDHLYRDVAPCARMRCDQPVAGLPRFQRRGPALRARRTLDACRPQPVRADGGLPAPARGGSRQGGGTVRHALRRRIGDHDHRGRHAGPVHRGDGLRAAGRRGDRVRAGLRRLRAVDRTRGRHASAPAAGRTGLPTRLGGGGRRDHAAHAHDHDQHPAQPHGHGLDAGRPRSPGRADAQHRHRRRGGRSL